MNMNMMSMKMMAVMIGMGVLGYMYFQKNPDKLQQMKEMGKDIGKEASRKMYNKLDNE